jgi:hypothetical protein
MAERVEKLTIEVGGRNKAGGVFAEVERSVDRLKARFGPRSFMKDLTEIAVGGGALAGIGFVGRTFAELTKGVTGFADKLAEGKTSTVELVAELAKGLPIVGGFAQGFEAILLSVTGIGSEMKKIAADTAATDAKTGRMKGLGDLVRQAAPGMNSGQIQALVDRALPGDLNEEQVRKRLAEQQAVIGRGRTAVPKQITENVLDQDGVATGAFRIVNQADIDAAKKFNDEFDKALDAAREYQKILEAITQIRGAGSGVPFNRDPLTQAILESEKAARNAPINFPNSPTFGVAQGGADPLLAGIASRQGAVGSALAMAEAALAQMQAGRGGGGGGSAFATADTRRGITGVRSIGGGASEMTAAEKETIAVIKELKKEQEKANKASDEVKALLGPALRNIEKYLNPDSET